jgi:hypothetical protein
LIVSDEDDKPVEGKGRDVGKTTLVETIAQLVGGVIAVRARESIEELMKRLLSESCRTLRVGLLDNLKTHRFSWDDFEGLITAEYISGRQLYVGEGRRPNIITWFLTMNAASLSRDMTQLVVPNMLTRPKYAGRWTREVQAFIKARRWEIVGDILAALRAEPGPELPGYGGGASGKTKCFAGYPTRRSASGSSRSGATGWTATGPRTTWSGTTWSPS